MTTFGPEDDETRIARLERELKASESNNYLLQDASARVVWNNDHLRQAMTRVVDDIGDDATDPVLIAIADRLAKAMKETFRV